MARKFVQSENRDPLGTGRHSSSWLLDKLFQDFSLRFKLRWDKLPLQQTACWLSGAYEA